jgi:hypothetical protein
MLKLGCVLGGAPGQLVMAQGTGGLSIVASSALSITKVVLGWSLREAIGSSAVKQPPPDPLAQMRQLVQDGNRGLDHVRSELTQIESHMRNGFGLVLSQLSGAEQSLAEIMQSVKTPARTWSQDLIAQAEEYYRRHLPDLAIQALEAAFAPVIFPGNFVARRLLSEVLLRAFPNKWREALNHAHLAACYSEAMSKDERESQAERAFAAAEAAEAYYIHGTIHQRNGELVSAERSFDSAIRLNPEMAEAYYRLAHVFLGLGSEVRAAWALEQARAGVSIIGTQAEAYLRARGITGRLDWPSLRFHAALWYRPDASAPRESWPGLLAAGRSVSTGHRPRRSQTPFAPRSSPPAIASRAA